jgi:hypothetical protein
VSGIPLDAQHYASAGRLPLHAPQEVEDENDQQNDYENPDDSVAGTSDSERQGDSSDLVAE